MVLGVGLFLYALLASSRQDRSGGVPQWLSWPILIAGATLTVLGRPPVTLLAETLEGWGHLCRLITAAHANAEKGRAQISADAIAQRAGGLTCVLSHGWTPEQGASLRDAFGEHLAVAWTRRLEPGDRARLRAADTLCIGLDTLRTYD